MPPSTRVYYVLVMFALPDPRMMRTVDHATTSYMFVVCFLFANWLELPQCPLGSSCNLRQCKSTCNALSETLCGDGVCATFDDSRENCG